MMVLLGVLTVVLGLALPEWVAAAAIPFVVVLETAVALPDVAALGGAEVRLEDLLLGAALLRLFGRLALRDDTRFGRSAALLLLLLGTFVVTTFLARGTLGGAGLLRSTTSLARFAVQSCVLLLVVASLRGPGQVRRLLGAVEAFGWVAAGTIILDVVLRPFGIRLGELQGEATGALRSFGVVGDSVGFILPYFTARAVAERRLVAAAVFAGAVYLTATIGAMLCLLVGLAAVLLLPGAGEAGFGPRGRMLALAGLAGLAFLAVLGAGTLSQRLSGGDLLAGGSGLQRLLSARLGLAVAASAPWSGVGFNGFYTLATRLGAQDLFLAEMGSFAENSIVNTGNQLLQTLCDGGVLALASTGLLLHAFWRAAGAAPAAVPDRGAAFFAFRAWLVALVVGNQTSAWILPSSVVWLLVLLVGGAASAAALLPPAAAED